MVIIDSGINNEIFNLNCIKESIGFSVTKDGTFMENSNEKITNNHGTIIALLIKYIFQEIELISMNILDENLYSNGNLLIYSLKKALLYKPDIIHMSLGTKKWRYRYRLKKLINKAIQEDIVIVSAASNDGKKSYPAYFRNVIGVKSSSNIYQKKLILLSKIFLLCSRYRS
ncbi:S8 family serine peptidase [Desulfosporosinus metallidurans]|uniref:S8 family serine peptidase n=1 Tax=Desulfosporosinus metallidurans TaxID=1888891 RepID=UPI00249EFFF1|nr:S8 family serine peptidase [Desulfosporosinus metallidurans]